MISTIRRSKQVGAPDVSAEPRIYKVRPSRLADHVALLNGAVTVDCLTITHRQRNDDYRPTEKRSLLALAQH
jgi:hypothetical protein